MSCPKLAPDASAQGLPGQVAPGEAGEQGQAGSLHLKDLTGDGRAAQRALFDIQVSGTAAHQNHRITAPARKDNPLGATWRIMCQT